MLITLKMKTLEDAPLLFIINFLHTVVTNAVYNKAELTFEKRYVLGYLHLKRAMLRASPPDMQRYSAVSTLKSLTVFAPRNSTSSRVANLDLRTL